MPDWTDDRTPRERVRTIAGTVTDPVSVNWVSEQANVGWQTAKDELEQLADRGDLRQIERDGRVRYVPDFTRQYTERIRELAVGFSREQLREEVVDAKSELDTLRSEYGVDTREELEASLSEASIDAEETRDRRHALREWESIADDLAVLEHALSLYEDLHDVDPFVESESKSRTDDATGTV